MLETFEAYLAAQSEPDREARRATLSELITDDFYHVGPHAAEAERSLETLLDFTDFFQMNLPGCSMVLRAHTTHAEVLRATVDVTKEDGTVMLVTQMFAVFADGKVSTIATFMGTED